MISVHMSDGRVLVEVLPWPTKTASGLELPDSVEQCATVAVVAESWDETVVCCGEFIMMMPYAGIKVGRRYRVVRVQDILMFLPGFDPDSLEDWEELRPA